MEGGLPRDEAEDPLGRLGYIYSNGSQSGAILPPKGHLATSGDIFGYHNQARGVLLASSEQRPRMLLQVLQRTGQRFSTKSYPSSGAEVQKP